MTMRFQEWLKLTEARKLHPFRPSTLPKGTPSALISGRRRHNFPRAKYNDPASLLVHGDMAQDKNTLEGYREWLYHFKESIDYLIWRGRKYQERERSGPEYGVQFTPDSPNVLPDFWSPQEVDQWDNLQYAIEMINDVGERVDNILHLLDHNSPNSPFSIRYDDYDPRPKGPDGPDGMPPPSKLGVVRNRIANLLRTVDEFVQQEKTYIQNIYQTGRRTGAANLIRDMAIYLRSSGEVLRTIMQQLGTIARYPGDDP